MIFYRNPYCRVMLCLFCKVVNTKGFITSLSKIQYISYEKLKSLCPNNKRLKKSLVQNCTTRTEFQYNRYRSSITINIYTTTILEEVILSYIWDVGEGSSFLRTSLPSLLLFVQCTLSPLPFAFFGICIVVAICSSSKPLYDLQPQGFIYLLFLRGGLDPLGQLRSPYL